MLKQISECDLIYLYSQVQISNKIQLTNNKYLIIQRAMQKLAHQTQSINTDMSLLYNISHSPLDAASAPVATITNLQNLLKARNAKYQYNQQERDESHDWFRRKGVDIKPLVGRIEVIKQNNIKEKEKDKASSECYFYVPPLNIGNQEEYIGKNFEYGVFNSLQHVMSAGKGSRGGLARRVLDKKIQEKSLQQTRWKVDLPVVTSQARTQKKKQLYVDAVSKFIQTETNLNSERWISYFRTSVHQQFWDILHGQTSKLADASIQADPRIVMAIESLKLVEAEFHALYPTNYENLVNFISKKFTSKLDKSQYESDAVSGPIWAVPFVLYQAGRKEDFYSILRDQDLKVDFMAADQSIKRYEPKAISRAQIGNDVFYRQLIHILKGSPIFQADALCDRFSIEYAWLVLRTSGIMGDHEKFDLFRNNMYQYYISPLMDEKKIKNFLYLFMYAELAEIGPNQIMDQDDYLHFLIAIAHNPVICRDPKIKTVVQKKLTEQLVEYINELLLEKNENYLNYIFLMPEQNIPSQISSIIASSHLLDKIDWRKLRERISNKVVYENLVNQTLGKYLEMHQDYILVAKRSCDLLNSSRKAIEHILDFFIKSATKIRASESDLKEAESVAKDLFQKDKTLKERYIPIFNFFEDYRILSKLIYERDQQKLLYFIRTSNYLLISENLKLDAKFALEHLITQGGSTGFDVYINFVENTLRAFEITLISLNKTQELKEMQNVILNALHGLLNIEPYSQYAQSSSVLNLLEVLNVSLSNF